MQASPSNSLECLELRPRSGVVAQIVVLLHGYGRNAALMRKMAGEVAARLPQALILMPHAPEAYETPESSEGNVLSVPQQLRGEDAEEGADGLRRQWFSIDAATLEDMRQKTMQAAGRVNEFLTQALAENGLSESDAALMGFSQGGAVALYAAYYRPVPVRCVAGHSTLFMGGDHMPSKPPTLYIYGLDDEEFSRQRFESGVRQLRAQIPNLTVEAVAGLRHTTNMQSRHIVADYIARHFNQTP
ncbi:MAG: hypothetical protein HYS17_11830 [Micavibrio aeruginosavorus]|uniref:Phospholipase/carboxylesterase/thioesterase domain-containing protein n=1 Tax=Micavibrio aeruginosavorus TaxID=349221 RepID=A0A7T5R2C3_9BACT|nr:MAG: hypothetical protein HYS17_11830 [Micavibrio aeruginosavorus]